MSILLSSPSSIPISDISREDLYNSLYWDHRLYDIRSNKDYIENHICRAHHMNPSPIVSVDAIVDIDARIDDDYGRAEHPSKVIIYTNEWNSSWLSIRIRDIKFIDILSKFI